MGSECSGSSFKPWSGKFNTRIDASRSWDGTMEDLPVDQWDGLVTMDPKKKK